MLSFSTQNSLVVDSDTKDKSSHTMPKFSQNDDIEMAHQAPPAFPSSSQGTSNGGAVFDPGTSNTYVFRFMQCCKHKLATNTSQQQPWYHDAHDGICSANDSPTSAKDRLSDTLLRDLCPSPVPRLPSEKREQDKACGRWIHVVSSPLDLFTYWDLYTKFLPSVSGQWASVPSVA